MFAKVPMSGKLVSGRKGLVDHIHNGEFILGSLVNLSLKAHQLHGTTVKTDEEGYGVETAEFGVIEIYSPKYNNLTMHGFVGMRYAL